MFDYEIFEGAQLSVSAAAKYESGFHWEEVSHADQGDILSGDDVAKVVEQILDHVNESEELINPFDVGEPDDVSWIGDTAFLEWRGVLHGLDEGGESDSFMLTVEVDKIA